MSRAESNSDATWAGATGMAGLLMIVDPGNLFREDYFTWFGLFLIAAGVFFFMSAMRHEANLATCSACRNEIHKDATVCQHCGTNFN
jgi:hypothetical protein